MKVLQIANDFAFTKVHEKLYRALDNKNVMQTVFTPVRSAEFVGRNCFNGLYVNIYYVNIVKSYHKYLYHVKRRCVFNELVKKNIVGGVDICHAATLFTDGGIAYLLDKYYHIPYIVAVRNTDVNGFLSVCPHTWISGVKILMHAKRIVFISEALKIKFERHIVIRPILNKIKRKFILIPNGVDDFFLDNICRDTQFNRKIIYVGDFSNNKNVVRLCEAVLQLKQNVMLKDVSLTLVGGGNNKTDEVEQMINKYPDIFNYIGKVTDRNKLLNLYRQHSVFAMPSIHETFGLVYVEALSQNLSVLYTKGQGIDGLFPNSVGIGVNPMSVEEITKALTKLLINRCDFSNKDVDFSQFRWERIADKYIEYYNSSLNVY